MLHLVRPDHLAVQDRVGEAGRDRVDPRDDAVGVRVELARRAARVAHVCGTHCVNIDTTCLPSGASVGSNTRRDADVGERQPRPGGRRPRPGTRPRCRRATRRARSCRRAPRDRSRACAVNSGSRSTATFTFTVPLRVFHRSMRSTKSVGQLGAVDLVEERDLRMRRRDHDVGAQLLARLERDTAHPPVAHVDARDRRVGAHDRAVRYGRVAQRAGSRRPCRLRESPTSRAGRRRRHRSCGAPSRTRCRPNAARPTCRSRRSPRARPASAATRSTRRGGRRCSS